MIDVVLTPEAFEQLDELPAVIRARMAKLVERLKGYPEVSGVKWLRGNLAGHGRLRTGDYRLQFRIKITKTLDEESGEEREELIVEKVGHRDGFYGGSEP